MFFQAEDGIRDLVRSRGLGDVYKRQAQRTEEIIRARAAGHDVVGCAAADGIGAAAAAYVFDIRDGVRAACAVLCLSLIHI